jgi:hypothetical protein
MEGCTWANVFSADNYVWGGFNYLFDIFADQGNATNQAIFLQYCQDEGMNL